MPNKFIRFVVDQVDPVTGRKIGFFQAAYKLKRSQRLTDEDQPTLQILLDWFETNLNAPDKFARSSNPRAHGKALSWFRPNAFDHIARSRKIQQILVRYGVEVRMLTSEHPGYIMFDDDVQIAAVPFREE